MTVSATGTYKSIGQVSKELGIEQHVLRFWESKFPKIRPVKRSNGRRYYREEDLVFIRSVQKLLHDEGYSIRGLQKLLGSFKNTSIENINSELSSLTLTARLKSQSVKDVSAVTSKDLVKDDSEQLKQLSSLMASLEEIESHLKLQI